MVFFVAEMVHLFSSAREVVSKDAVDHHTGTLSINGSEATSFNGNLSANLSEGTLTLEKVFAMYQASGKFS